MATRFMCSLVVMDAIERDILPTLAVVPEMLWDPTKVLVARVEGGETADGILAIDDTLDRLVAGGFLDAGSIVPVVTSDFGIAMAADVPAPTLETVDDFVALLRRVSRICYSKAGASGVYFEALMDRLGIRDEIAPKCLVVPAGLTGEKVISGEVELAIQQISELMGVKGIGSVVPLPPDIQQKTAFSAALFRNADDADGARAFIAALVTPAAAEAYKASGLDPRFEA